MDAVFLERGIATLAALAGGVTLLGAALWYLFQSARSKRSIELRMDDRTLKIDPSDKGHISIVKEALEYRERKRTEEASRAGSKDDPQRSGGEHREPSLERVHDGLAEPSCLWLFDCRRLALSSRSHVQTLRAS